MGWEQYRTKNTVKEAQLKSKTLSLSQYLLALDVIIVVVVVVAGEGYAMWAVSFCNRRGVEYDLRG